LLGLTGLTVAMSLALGATAAIAQAGGQCWSPADLRAVPGEARVRQNVREAFLDPPSRMPVRLTPTGMAHKGAIRRVAVTGNAKLVALTFDLCEQPYEVSGYQGDLVDYLRDRDVRATFFVGGKWLLTHRMRAHQLMSDPRFEVANHTWEHRNLRLVSGAALLREIEGAQTAYEQVRDELVQRQCVPPQGLMPARSVKPAMRLFRFPFGACNEKSLAAVHEYGLMPIQWDVSSGDPWVGQKAETMIAGVVNRVRPGSIVLFHANGRGWHTGAALPVIIDQLKAKGYRFVTVSELLASGQPEYAPSCYDETPGDSDRYDGLAARLEQAYFKARERFRAQPVGEVGKSLPPPPEPVLAPRPPRTAPAPRQP
jgi:peptidoglycan/xylan/chitin deacetylase (PgdA/CDA1 family)